MKSPSEDAPLTVRPLTPQDADGLVDLYNELTFGPKTAQRGDILAVMEHPGTTIHGALADGRVVGMVTLHILPNVTWGGRPYALIENVATAENWRLRGVGRRVMQSAIDKARDEKVYKIMLLTGRKRGALGFYESVGFDREDKHGLVIRFN